jgi:Binding-protein-dependent transport system inner membrane component
VGLTRAEMIWHIILPVALPSALVGLRYGIGVAWLSLMVGEQVNASSGIGYRVINARKFVRTDIIFVGLIVYSLLGLAADALVRKLESAALFCRPRRKNNEPVVIVTNLLPVLPTSSALSASEPVVRLRELTRAFDQRVVLDSLNLEIERGSFTALPGHSGLIRCRRRRICM